MPLSRRKLEQGQNAFMKSWRRVENMRRGGMVSMIKTAARNFQSATIRAPMEALENVMDSTLLAMSNEFRIRRVKVLSKRHCMEQVEEHKHLYRPLTGRVVPLHYAVYIHPLYKRKKLQTTYLIDLSTLNNLPHCLIT